MNAFIELGARFGLNLAVVVVIVRLIYYPQRRDKDYVFTFFAFNTIIFFVMGLLNNTELSIGVGFGLFAIFSVLRYRTHTIPIREMTYLFVLIALPVINSIMLEKEHYEEFALINLAIAGGLFVLEQEWGFHYEVRKVVTYERIDNIRPDNWPVLMADLKKRTGLPIERIEIGKINFLRDTADITIYYDARALSPGQVRLTSNHAATGDNNAYDN